MSTVITAEHLSFSYPVGTGCAHQALRDVSFTVESGALVGLLGANGSGKSTLVQLLNGILQPTSGSMTVCGIATSDSRQRKGLWRHAGLVFQYPEQQIFQTTVYDEVAYGPRNLGLTEAEVGEGVREALQMVGIDEGDAGMLPPASLSGGMQRRVAIAGMVAIHPEVLIMDEPFAGLDTVGRKLIVRLVRERQHRKQTTILIAHELQEIMGIADKIMVLDHGALAYYGEPSGILSQPELLCDWGLQVPRHLQALWAFADNGLELTMNAGTMREAGVEIVRALDARSGAMRQARDEGEFQRCCTG